jgi:alpha-tubulin suppressor-like RCC1 family protein
MIKKLFKNSYGFGHFELVLALLIIGIVSVTGYTVASHHSKASAQSSSEVSYWGAYGGGGPDKNQQSSPTSIGSLSNITMVQAGNSSDYALQCVGGASSCSTDGTVWAWGNNKYGQLGDGTNKASVTTPVQVIFPSGTNIVAIGEARDNGYAIDSNGNAWAWGYNEFGSLCIGSSNKQLTPVRVPGITGAVSVEGGAGHVIWLLSNGTVKSCGNNFDGVLGNGTTTNSSTPVNVSGLTNITQISSGDASAGAVSSSGTVYMWGDNALGQLGIGTTTGYESVPTQVNLPSAAKQLDVGGSDSAKNGSSIVLLSDNSVYDWGSNAYGQLGNGTTTNENSPALMDVPAGVTFTQVAMGGQTGYGLDSSGNVWAWGSSNEGQLGNGTKGPKVEALKPIDVDSGADWISSTALNVVDDHTN